MQRDEIQPEPDGEAIRAWLHRRLADLLGVAPEKIVDSQPLTVHGLSSMAAVSLAGELEDWLGVELADDLLWEYPTIDQIVCLLAARPR